MNSQQSKIGAAATAALIAGMLLSAAPASAGLVGGVVNGAGGVVNGTGGAIGGVVGGNGSVGGTLNGTVNGTLDGTTITNGTLNGSANGNGASATANGSSNTTGNASLGKALNASFAGSTNANASASASTPQLPNADKTIQSAYATMQNEKSTGQLVLAKAEKIRGTVTDVADNYVSFVSQKGMTYVAAVQNAAKSGLHKGSQILANSENYGQNVQLTLDTSVAQSSNTKPQSSNTTTAGNASNQ